MSQDSPATHIATRIQHQLLVDTRYVSHLRALLAPEPVTGFYRTDGEAVMAKQIEVLSIQAATGGDGPGPDKTFVTVVVPNTSVFYSLAYYWGRRELRLQQRDGALDNIGQAMQRDPLSVNPY
jgi:hypothetical protein